MHLPSPAPRMLAALLQVSPQTSPFWSGDNAIGLPSSQGVAGILMYNLGHRMGEGLDADRPCLTSGCQNDAAGYPDVLFNTCPAGSFCVPLRTHLWDLLV